jgi:hypothetical protein
LTILLYSWELSFQPPKDFKFKNLIDIADHEVAAVTVTLSMTLFPASVTPLTNNFVEYLVQFFAIYFI